MTIINDHNDDDDSFNNDNNVHIDTDNNRYSIIVNDNFGSNNDNNGKCMCYFYL